MNTMRAAILEQPGTMRVERVPLPEPGPGQARVRLEGCGVCASNLPPWEGREWFSYPMAPGALGHEGWGVIDKIGTPEEPSPGSQSLSDPSPEGKGEELVSPLPLGRGQPRNECDGAGVGSEATLRVGDRVSLLSYHAYAEYDVADANTIVPLPPALDRQPFPGEPLGCAVNIFRRSGVQAGQTVAIVGIGFLGALLVQMAAEAGARVLAVARRPFAQAVAKDMGADTVIAMDDHWQVIEQAKTLTDGAFCDVVIECVGKQWPLDLSGELTRERGRLVIAGYHQDGLRQVNLQLWNWRGLDVINAHERDPMVYTDGIRAAAQAVADHQLSPSPLYTHTFPLEGLGDALNATRDRPDGFLKALVTFS